MALGRVVPARRAIAASSAREGEKARNGFGRIVVSVKSLEKLILDVFWVVYHDSDLKNRCCMHLVAPRRQAQRGLSARIMRLLAAILRFSCPC